MNDLKIIKLETHDTRDIHDKHVNGSLTVIWRDWDNIIKDHPKMIYVTSVHPGEVKGPHIHTKRDSYFFCILGKVVLITKDKMGKYNEKILHDNEPELIHIPKNVPSMHINLSENISKILVLADVSWKPNDNEMKNVEFSDYDYSKWKIKGKN